MEFNLRKISLPKNKPSYRFAFSQINENYWGEEQRGKSEQHSAPYFLTGRQ